MTTAKVSNLVEPLNGVTKDEIDSLFDLLPGKYAKLAKQSTESKRVLSDLKWINSMKLVWDEEEKKELAEEIKRLKWFLGE